MIIKLQDKKAQLITVNENLINTKRIVETDKEQLFKKKNILIYKQDELKEQLITVEIKAAGPNVIPGKRLRKGELKAKRLPPFDRTKGTL